MRRFVVLVVMVFGATNGVNVDDDRPNILLLFPDQWRWVRFCFVIESFTTSTT